MRECNRINTNLATCITEKKKEKITFFTECILRIKSSADEEIGDCTLTLLEDFDTSTDLDIFMDSLDKCPAFDELLLFSPDSGNKLDPYVNSKFISEISSP